jgi:hypothetical protein
VTLRLAAALAFLFGAAGLLLYLHIIGKGPTAPLAARHLREMKDRIDPPEHPRPVTSTAFDSLPGDWSVAEYSALENGGVTLEGYVQRMIRASDGDVHLEIAPTLRLPLGPDTAYVTGEITDLWRRHRPALTWERLAAVFRPNSGLATPWAAGPARVRLTGWLLFDFQNNTLPSAYSRTHGARISAWEIHPVTRIERWSDRAGRFEDVAR